MTKEGKVPGGTEELSQEIFCLSAPWSLPPPPARARSVPTSQHQIPWEWAMYS